MRIIFAGTPPFAATALRSLHAAGHEIALVLSQPDRPAGRGQRLTASAVSQLAADLRLPLAKPENLRNIEATELVARTAAEVMVVAAYGMLLPLSILNLPARGCLNIHASLLPRWRGAAPIARAVEAGDLETGITIMQMDVGLDTGAMLLKRVIPVGPQETSGTLMEKLALVGASAMVHTLDHLDSLMPISQPSDGVTYAKKIEKTEARVDWNASAQSIERRIRAFDPFPGCDTVIAGERLKLWHANIVPHNTALPPGAVASIDNEKITINCGEDALSITRAQRPGGRRMAMREILQSVSITQGQRCE
jgi:methionyl-tRNA formyltransferase